MVVSFIFTTFARFITNHNIVCAQIRNIVLLILLFCSGHLYAIVNNPAFMHCDIGLQGGASYYVGDATPHIFTLPLESYGAFFRYRFTQRWDLKVQGNAQRVQGYLPDGTGFADKNLGKWTNQLVGLDVTAEFNFFRFNESQYDSRVKPYTPYISTGLGMCIHDQFRKVSAYVPFIVGFKWKFASHFGLHVAWQHNVYFADNIEGIKEYDNLHELNGSNILNNDVTGTVMVGLTVSFAAEEKMCLICH